MGVRESRHQASRATTATTSARSRTSPSRRLDPKILWVGTDDGNVQLTTDGGATWTEVSWRDHRCQERHVRRRHRRVGRVARHGVRVVRRAPRRRLRAVHFPHHRFRQDVDGGHQRPSGGRRVGAQPRGVSGQAECPVRRHGARAVRDARQRRPLGAADGEPADDALRRHRRPSADEGSRARHARPRHLDSRRCVADCGVDAGDRAKRAHLFAVPRRR